MPKVTLLLTLLFSGFLSTAPAQNCGLSGTPAWSKQLRTVIADCDNRFASPNGKLLLRIDPEGKVRVSQLASDKEVQIHSAAVEPPAMVSWSPNSDAFFVNDGEGSGMASTFRLFRMNGDQAVEDGTVERQAVGLYRSQTKCASAAADPNVWGIGWSAGGTSFYLLVQATANDPCGTPGTFIGMRVKLADGAIVEQFSEAATKQRFHALLPREVYSK